MEDLSPYLSSVGDYAEPPTGPAPRTSTKPLTLLTAPLPINPHYKTSSFEDLVSLYFDLMTVEGAPSQPAEVKYAAALPDYTPMLALFDTFNGVDAGSDLCSSSPFKAPALAPALVWRESTLLNVALAGPGPFYGLRTPLTNFLPSPYTLPSFPLRLYPWSNPAFDL